MNFLIRTWYFFAIFLNFLSIRPRFSSAEVLFARQQTGVTSPSSFLRRGYHASAVAGNFLYIDGGEFSTYDDGDVDFEYSDTLLAIDLSKNWTNSTVVLHSTSKPTSVPSLVYGGLWYDEGADMLYTGFAGRISTFNTSNLEPYPMGIWSFKPDGLGSGTWDVALDSSASVFDSITRPYTCAIAYGAGIGYALGGSMTYQTAPDVVDSQAIVTLSGMLKFDMATNTLSNVTVDVPRFHGVIQYASMLYVPNFGPEGVFVVLGGYQADQNDNFLDWETVSLFDPASGSWWDQETTGNTPEGRKEFCTAGLASDNSTYEIFVYAGWGGNLGTESVQFDQIYILTLPAFHWIKVDYSPTGTRHALTCHAVGGAQILTIGGVNTASTDDTATIYKGTFRDKDKYTQGLAVFDMSTLSWVDQYTANASAYKQSDLVQSYYAKNARSANFNSTDLQTVFATTNFTTSTSVTKTGTNSTISASAAAGYTPASSSFSLSGAAIAGITVGAVVGVAILAGSLLLYCCITRRRRRRQQQLPATTQSNQWFDPYPPQEMQGDALAELYAHQRPCELQGPAQHSAHEKDGRAVAELPADQGTTWRWSRRGEDGRLS